MDEEQETYTYEWVCDNCGTNLEMEIPVGTTVREYLEKAKCEDCECLAFDKMGIDRVEKAKESD